MHLRRKLRPEKPTPSTFEIIPATGTLQPSQRQNIQVKFMPTEQVEVTDFSYYVDFSLNRQSHVVPRTCIKFSERFFTKKGKDVDLYSAFHAPGTPNAHTSLKLTRQTAI